MPLVFSAERAVSLVTGTSSFVIVDSDFNVHVEGSEYLAWLRSADRSVNTERVYAGRIARFLTYCACARLDWRTVSVAELTAFLRELVAEPLTRRTEPAGLDEVPVRVRSNKTANAIMTAVTEFLKFAASREWVSPVLVSRLSYPRVAWTARGSRGAEWTIDSRSVIQAKSLKLRDYRSAPASFTDEQLCALKTALPNIRDRLLASLLLESGMRVGEALGLRREDMHLLASSSSLGCPVKGPHVHVRRRVNANGALAKSAYPRSIPLTNEVIDSYADYQFERADLVPVDRSDFVFINLYRPPVAGPLKYPNAKKMFERVGQSVGFAVRPHMFRHTAATRWLAAGVARDVVQDLLGHAHISSLDVYSHPSDAVKRAAIEKVAKARHRDE